MDVRFDDATEAFRQEVRTWLEANVPKEPRPSDPDGAFHYMRAWQKKMFDGGWVGIHWPKSYGGRGAPPPGETGLPPEVAPRHAPPPPHTLVALIVWPTPPVRRTEERKKRHIPPLLNSAENSCPSLSHAN